MALKTEEYPKKEAGVRRPGGGNRCVSGTPAVGATTVGGGFLPGVGQGECQADRVVGLGADGSGVQDIGRGRDRRGWSERVITVGAGGGDCGARGIVIGEVLGIAALQDLGVLCEQGLGVSTVGLQHRTFIGWVGDGRDDGDDGYHDHQLDQGEARATWARCMLQFHSMSPIP